jgi:hypothetical protein
LAGFSVLYTGYQTYGSGASTGTDFWVTLATNLVSAAAPPGPGAAAGVIQTFYDLNALNRKP